MNIWLVTIATLALILEIVVIWWGRTRLLSRISHFAISRSKSITSHKMRRVGLQQFMNICRMAVRLTSLTLILAGIFLWITIMMEANPGTKPWAGRLEHAIAHQLFELGTQVLSALPGIGMIAVIFFITRVLHELLSHFFRSIEDGEIESKSLDAVTAGATRRLAGVALWIASVIIAYPYIPGSQSEIFKGVSVLLGVMISLGSPNLMSQLVNGLVLIYTRTIRPGDYVRAGEHEGTVETLHLLSCSLRTPLGELITLPNSEVVKEVKNYSRPTPGQAVLFKTSVTIGYDTPWQQVRDLLLKAADRTPGLRKEPAPIVRQTALEDYYVHYELQFAPKSSASWRQSLSSLHEAIQSEFHTAGLQIMSPHYVADPEKAKIPEPLAPEAKAESKDQATP